MKVLAGPMATTEQFSRLTTVLATNRSLQGVDPAVVANSLQTDGNFQESVHFNLLKGLSEADAIRLAAIQNTVDNTHAVFGKFARNWNQRGFFGALPFAFMNFPIQALEHIFHLSKRAFVFDKNDPSSVERAAAARMSFAYLTASMFMMGGLAGMPAWELFKSIYEKVYYLAAKEKIDLNYEIAHVLKHTVQLPSPLVHAITEGGVSAITGSSVGARMSLPFFWQGLVGSALKGEVAVTDAMGVQGGLVNNVIKQTDKWMKDESTLPEAVLLGLSPVFVRNAFESLVSWPDEGAKTGRGVVLLTPEDISVGDQIKKALGFAPEKEANAGTAEYVQYLKVNGSNEFKSAKASELANIRLDIYREALKGNTKASERLRGEYSAKYQELLEFIRRSNPEGLSARQIDSLQRSIKQKYEMKKNPRKERNDKEQRVADEIRNTLYIFDEEE
jgi:hypothetical protein